MWIYPETLMISDMDIKNMIGDPWGREKSDIAKQFTGVSVL